MNDKQQLAALGDEWPRPSITRQRDELLAALEALVTIVADTRHPDPDDVYAVIAEARDAINKVGGEI